MDGNNLPQQASLEEKDPALAQIELERQKDQHTYEYSLRNLELTAQNNREVREVIKGNRNASLIVILASIFAIFAFVMYALYLGKDQFLSDMLKVIVGGFGGGGIGYAIGKRKREQ